MARTAGVKHARECPKCRDDLFERRLKDTGVRVDVCPGCRGIWFDNQELEAALGLRMPERFVPQDAQRSDRWCPSCGVLLFCFRYPDTDVQVDMCDKCHGIWLDSGELKGLEERYASSGWSFLRFVEKVLGGLGA